MLAVCLLVIVADARAANRRWNGAAPDDNFGTTGNWVGGFVPGTLDVAQFGISGGIFQSTYNVIFNNNATNQALHIEDDLVTFNLSGRTYTVTTANGIVIGNQAGGFSGRLTVNGGTISSTTNIDVGAAANTSGTLIVGANGLISGAPTLNIGKLGTGSLTVQADGDISSTGSTTIGVGAGITGTATIIGNGTAGSATLFTGTLNVGSTGTGTVNVQLGGLLQNSGAAMVGAGSLFTGVGTGTVNVMNTNSVWNSLGLLKVGDGGSGTVNITLGGKVTGVDNVIGASAQTGSSGEVNVNGPSSLWDNSGTVTVGALGPGTLNISNQGVVESLDGIISSSALGVGTGAVAVNGAGSQWNNTGDLTVGKARTGTLNITAGATVQNDFGIVGLDPSGTGTVTVDGSGSLWDNLGDLYVGLLGQGTLDITGGGTVRNANDGYVGSDPDSTGTVTVNGAGSLLDGSLIVGDFGEGTLNITGGGTVDGGVSVGMGSSGTGTVTVDGAGSLLDGGLRVGGAGHGILNITNGAKVQNGTLDIGSETGGIGTVTVTGAGSLWENESALIKVGVHGTGTLEIKDGGQVESIGASIGTESGGVGTVIVDDTGDKGSQWISPQSLVVGRGGTGQLYVKAGGFVHSNLFSTIGQSGDGVGTVTVEDPGSLWEAALLTVGDNGSGVLNILDGGHVVSGIGVIGDTAGGTGYVEVRGADSQWIMNPLNDFNVGYFGRGTLLIAEGALVQNGDTRIAYFDDGPGTDASVTVDGVGSRWITARLDVSGIFGDGTLNVTAGGVVQSSSARISARSELNTGSGFVTVSGQSSTWNISSSLEIVHAGELIINAGGVVNVGTELLMRLDSALNLNGGTLSTTEVSFSGGGDFNWTSGTLHVGTYHGNLTNPNGGVLAPGNSAGTTTIIGDYTQLDDATLEIEIGGLALGTQYDFVSVTGTAFVDGELDLTLTGGFIPNSSQTFVIANANNLLGDFDNADNGQRVTTSDGGGSFLIHYGLASPFNPNQVVLSAFQAALLPGDYNQNGVVDAADYTLWRDRLGSTTSLPNDNTAGVGPDDYTRWKNNFGNHAGSGSGAIANAAVPEPATWVLLILSVAGWRLRRRRAA